MKKPPREKELCIKDGVGGVEGTGELHTFC